MRLEFCKQWTKFLEYKDKNRKNNHLFLIKMIVRLKVLKLGFGFFRVPTEFAIVDSEVSCGHHSRLFLPEPNSMSYRESIEKHLFQSGELFFDELLPRVLFIFLIH